MGLTEKDRDDFELKLKEKTKEAEGYWKKKSLATGAPMEVFLLPSVLVASYELVLERIEALEKRLDAIGSNHEPGKED